MRLRTSLVCVLPLLFCLPPSIAQDPPSEAASGKPDSGVVEHAERRLVQLDVTVSGPREALDRLTAEDFEIVIGGRVIESFDLDRLCLGELRAAAQAERNTPLEQPEEGQRSNPTELSLLFYFDEANLRSDGRRRAIAHSRELIEALVRDGTRAMVVSAGRQVRAFSDWSSDPSTLLAAIDELEQAVSQIETYASTEEHRVDRVFRSIESNLAHLGATLAAPAPTAADLPGAPGGGGSPLGGPASNVAAPGNANPAKEPLTSAAESRWRNTALELQREEQWHAGKALGRLSMMLGRMTALPTPKAVIYFGDTLRANPGDHYWTLLAREVRPDIPVRTGYGNSFEPFQRVIDDAAALGVRFYTVQAAGLEGGLGHVNLPRTGQSHVSLSGGDMNRRFTDARNGLGSLASETGGRAFLGATPADAVARGIIEDLRCVFLVSFDAARLPQDRALSVLVNLRQARLSARTRSRLFVASSGRRLETRLAAAFDTPESESHELRVGLIPIGFEKKKFVALVQIAVPTSDSRTASWDLGFSVLSRERSADEASGRIEVDGPNVPLVLEQVVRFSPGPFEIHGVAHDLRSNRVLSRTIEGEWPDPRSEAPSVGPIALLQPSNGAFLRDETQRTHGALVLAPGDTVRADLPSSLIGIVCRGTQGAAGNSLRRSLTGSTGAEFPPIPLSSPEERCVAFGDLIRPGTMTAGLFRYEVHVERDQALLVSGAREFVAGSE